MISEELYEKTGNLRDEINKLKTRNVLSRSEKKDYFEPHMMEYLNQYDGEYNDQINSFLLKFKVMGTQYEGRIDEIELIKKNDTVQIKRNPENRYNKNNFAIIDKNDRCIGNMPWKLCDAMAPLFDSNNLTIESSKISYIEPLSKRSRHALKPIVFIEIKGIIREN